MKRLCLAYDGSSSAEVALENLTLAGLPEQLEACVISVADVWLPPDAASAGDPTAPPAVRKARAQAKASVDAHRSLARHAAAHLRVLFPNWKVEEFACGDSPSWGVVKHAEIWRADLIVLGAHSHSPLERFFLGSVSQKALGEARCSVRIARERRPKSHENLRVIVAVDGSADSEATVRAVCERQWPVSAQFRVVTVIDPKMETAVAWPSVYAAQWVQQGDEETREWVGRVVEHSAKLLADAKLSVETDILEGDPKKALLKFADGWDADTIFLGARGLQHGQHFLLGSTASSVAARAHCSVEVVRPTNSSGS